MKTISYPKRLFYLSVIIFLFTNIPAAFSQGGNDCAAAQANPVNIPFSGNGTICGAGTSNDYNYVGASCTDPYNTQGPDWLYYFCAPTSGNINVMLSNIVSYCTDSTMVYPYASISVWQGCPGTGNCVGGTSNPGYNPEMPAIVPVTAGQCYFIMIDNYPGYCPCFDFSIDISYEPIPVVQPACSNMGFDAGSFAGWSGSYGYTIVYGQPGASTPVYTPAYYTTTSPMHTITSGAGTDPLGGFPVVAPGGGTNSCMLGDGMMTGYGGATLQQTFNVTAANALLTYQYAVVIEDAAHTPEEQPFFKIEVFDCSGNPVACGQYLVVGGPNIPGFSLAPGYTDIYYKPWTPVAIDLTPYIGSCATVKFTVGDCALGGHFAYVYLDANCSPMNITGPTSICLGQSATLSAPPGAAAYSWAPGGQTTQSITESPSVSTTYTCTITSVGDSACTTFLTYQVNVLPAAIASASSQTTCAGSPVTITANTNTLGGTLSWSPGTGNTASITVAPVNTTTYVCTFTDSNGCTDTANAVVTVTPLPNVTVNSPAICPGDTALLIATGASVYVWSPGVTVTGNGTASVSPGTTTSYTVTGTTAGCSDTAVATVSNNGVLNITVNSPTICAGQTATLTASGANNYTWAGGAVSTGINTATVTPAATSSYTVTGTSGACIGTGISVVTVNPIPLVNVSSASVCAGASATLTASGANSYTWSAGLNSSGGNTASASPAVSSTYTVTGTSAGCSDTAVATIIINPLPVSNAGPDLILCTGTAGNLGFAGNAGDTYAWSPATDLSNAGIPNPSVTLTNNGSAGTSSTYTVTTTSAAGCTSADEVIVYVDPVQTANAGSPQFACYGSLISLNGAVGGSATGGTWSGGSGIFSPNANTLNANYTPNAADSANGFVVLTLTSTGNGTCPPASSNVTLNFYPAPVVNFTVDDPDGCPVHCVSFTDLSTVAGGGSIASWSWTFGDDSVSTLQNPSHCYVNTGQYDVSLTVTSSNGCQSSLFIDNMINVFPVPVAEFNPDPNPASIFNGNITMHNLSSSDVNYWYWNFGDGDTLAPAISDPVHSYSTESPGIYLVTLIVQNTFGCYDTVQHPVEVGKEFTFYVPNCVTPNGDGINDYFQGYGIGIDLYDMWIYDRWGNMIFHGNALNDKWDGRANGGEKIAQEDVYVWKVKLTDVFGRKHNYIGKVSIVK